jgi:hypothetical protein
MKNLTHSNFDALERITEYVSKFDVRNTRSNQPRIQQLVQSPILWQLQRKPKNKTYAQQSDFKKRQWLSQRPRLQLALEQLAADINHLHPPPL